MVAIWRPPSAWLARLAVRRARTVLIAAMVLTGASLVAVRSLGIEANLVALLPDSLEPVRNLHRIIDKTGGFGDVVVLVEGGSDKAKHDYLAELTPAVRHLPWVRRAEFRLETESLEPFAALYMDEPDLEAIRDRLQRRLEHAVGASLELGDAPPKLDFSDITRKYERRRDERCHRGLFRSKDGRIRALRIIPEGGVTSDLRFGRRILADVRRLVKARAPQAKAHGLTITVAGKYYNRVQDYRAVIADVKRSALWGGLLILTLLTIYFRHWAAAPLILLPLGMSLSWTFALTRLTIGHLNVITAFLFVILLGLGIDFGIHLLARYRAERQAGLAAEPAWTKTLRFTGRACLTSGMTTSAAFASLMVTDFKGFSQFGFIAALGVALALLAMVAVLPALLVLAEQLRLVRFPPTRDPEEVEAAQARAAASAAGSTAGSTAGSARLQTPDSTAGRLGVWAVRGLGLAALLALALAVAGGARAGLGHIRFEYDFNKLNTLPAEVTAVKEKTRRVFRQSSDSAVVFADSLAEAAALERAVRAYMKRDPTPTIERVRSLNSLREALPEKQQAKLPIIREIKRLLEKRAIGKAIEKLPKKQRERIAKLQRQVQTRRMTVRDLPEQLRQPFHGLPGVPGSMVFIVNREPLKDARYAAAFVEDTREFETAAKTYHPASEAVVYAETISLLQSDGVIAIGATLATVLLLLLLDFRRPGPSLLVFVPLASALGWLALIMASWPISLNMYNLVVLPSLIGIGIDNSVHFYHRYEELGPRRMGQVWRSILGPITATTLTTMVGFGGMISAHQAGLQSIGVLAVLGMALSLLSVATLMPAMLLWLAHRRPSPRSNAS